MNPLVSYGYYVLAFACMAVALSRSPLLDIPKFEVISKASEHGNLELIVNTLVNCALCIGMLTGFFGTLIVDVPTLITIGGRSNFLASALATGFITAVSSTILDRIVYNVLAKNR